MLFRSQILENDMIKILLKENSKNLVMESIHEELDDIRKNISNGCAEDVISNRITNLIENIRNNLINKKTYN